MYITGHIGYIKLANVSNLTNKLFYCGKLQKGERKEWVRQKTKRKYLQQA